MSSLVLSRLDYSNATLAGIPSYFLQSVMNSAARLVFSSPKYDHITPLLHQLHWMTAPERIQFKLAVLVYQCLHETAPSYLADELEYTADFWGPETPSMCLLTVAKCPSYTAVHRRWSGLPGCCCPTVPVLGTVCRSTSRPHLLCLILRSPQSFLFRRSFPWILTQLMYSACAMTVVNFGHLNRSLYLLTYLLTYLLI